MARCCYPGCDYTSSSRQTDKRSLHRVPSMQFKAVGQLLNIDPSTLILFHICGAHFKEGAIQYDHRKYAHVRKDVPFSTLIKPLTGSEQVASTDDDEESKVRATASSPRKRQARSEADQTRALQQEINEARAKIKQLEEAHQSSIDELRLFKAEFAKVVEETREAMGECRNDQVAVQARIKQLETQLGECETMLRIERADAQPRPDRPAVLINTQEFSQVGKTLNLDPQMLDDILLDHELLNNSSNFLFDRARFVKIEMCESDELEAEDSESEEIASKMRKCSRSLEEIKKILKSASMTNATLSSPNKEPRPSY